MNKKYRIKEISKAGGAKFIVQKRVFGIWIRIFTDMSLKTLSKAEEMLKLVENNKTYKYYYYKATGKLLHNDKRS